MVLVTAPDQRVARRLAKAVLEARAAACVNILPRVESHYWWQGALERGSELLLIIKTRREKLAELESLVLSNHPYDTPEFLVLGIEGGNRRYLDWLEASTPACDE